VKGGDKGRGQATAPGRQRNGHEGGALRVHGGFPENGELAKLVKKHTVCVISAESSTGYQKCVSSRPMAKKVGGVQRFVFLQLSESTECYRPTRRQRRRSGLYTRSANPYCRKPYMIIAISKTGAAPYPQPATRYPGYNLSAQLDCYSERTDGRLF